MRKLYDRYLALSFRRPVAILVVAAAVTALAIVAASRLGLKTDLRELLPQHYRSIEDLKRIERRVGGIGTLTVTIESPAKKANFLFVEELAARLRAFPKSEVSYLDYHIREEKRFFERNKLLYVDLKDLEKFRDRLRAKIEEERRKHNPLELGLEAHKPAAPLELEKYKKKYRAKLAKFDRYPDGYQASKDGRIVTLDLRIAGSSTGVDGTRRILAKVRRVVAELGPARFHPEMRIRYTGNVMTALEEYQATKSDLFVVSAVCFGLELLIIVLYFFNLRSLMILGIPLLMGTVWTLGLTALAIGFLNASTMFLASIVAGNGVNFGIILLARYFEERRSGLDPREATRVATRFTARATMVASLAAGVAYGSLLVTDFRGFNQFGFIGGIGMVLCWLSTFAVMPPLCALSERWRPFVRGPAKRPRWSPFSAAFARLSTRFPRSVVTVATLLFIGAGVLGALFLYRDPFLYNFRYLRNVRSRDEGAGAVAHKVRVKVGSASVRPPGMIVLADRLEQVPPIANTLRKIRDSKPFKEQSLGGVYTIYRFIPWHQKRKLVVLRDIRRLITKNALKFLSPNQRKEALKLTPPADLKEIGIADLPEKMARPFTDVSGTRGLLIYVNLAPRMSHWDGRDLLQFAAAVRSVRLSTGEEIRSSGHPVIFADMLKAVLTDGPRAVLFSLVGVVLLLIFAFRRFKPIVLTIGALGVGLAWLLGAMGGWDFLIRELQAAKVSLSEGWVNGIPKLNFLNFIVLPLTIGIGADYAVNIVHRYGVEGPGSVRRVIESTGGAVVLCSLTTIIGYSSLLLSNNLALVSFGKLAGLGELACVVAAVAVLPSAVTLLERGHSPPS